MLTVANVTRRDNHILFIGDSRVREQFHEFVGSVVGVPQTHMRAQINQLVPVPRLRLRVVRDLRRQQSVRNYETLRY